MRPLNINFKLIQAVLWLIVYAMLLVYFGQKNAWDIGFTTSTIFIIFYSTAVYGNANYLIIKYFQQKKYILYTFLSFIFLLLTVLLRIFIENHFLNNLLSKHAFYGWNIAHFAFVWVTQFLAFLFGFLLRMSIDYVSLLHKQEILKNKQLSSELNLLKAQVQPHFLFNTLNNIYSLSISNSPKTSEMIAKLSEMMRYFVDEAPKEKVSLQTEIQFLKNYIELEQIRMVNPLKLDFSVSLPSTNYYIPPMLLMPFVENIFKHGIDKVVKENKAVINLEVRGEQLHYTVTNKVITQEEGTWRGLENLQKRLELLYSDTYHFRIYQENGYFYASLSFPIA